MPDLNCPLWMTVHLFDLGGLNLPLAYVGMGPEFVPYFMALLGVIGAALVAVVQWPISALLGWLKGKRNRSKDAETPAASESRALCDVDQKQMP